VLGGSPEIRVIIGGSSEIQVITSGSGSNYTYPTLTLTSIQIYAIKPYLWTRPYLESKFNPRIE